MASKADQDDLRSAVRGAYTAIAEVPEGQHPIPVGRELALGVGYPPALLAELPQVAVEAFAGVSNVSLFAHIDGGSTVLDLGCGAGLDSLIAARRAGPRGLVVGVDFSAAMVTRAHAAATEQGADRVQLCVAESDRLPLHDSSIDLALVNGIFNLNPRREDLFRELHRVLKPRGAVYSAELILREDLPEADKSDAANWFA